MSMIDVALHTGSDHPNLALLLVSSVLSFVLGVGIGSYSARVRGWLRSRNDATAE